MSHVRTLDGLIINDFKESVIYCTEKIDSAMCCVLVLFIHQKRALGVTFLDGM